MEHRCSLRHSTNVRILIYKSGLPKALGRLRNVSRHGLFISTDYDNVALNQLLEIEILGERCERRPHKRCRAMVAHATAHGFGLAVDEDCDISAELVEELLSRCGRRANAFYSLQTAEAAVPKALHA
jgi:hypothetical protein